MHKLRTLPLSIIMVLLVSIVGIPAIVRAYTNPAQVPLLSVANFAALAKTSISSPTGPTVLNDGDMGIASPGTCTNFAAPCTGPINGTIIGGALEYQTTDATTAQTDATTVVADIGGRTADAEIADGLLDGLTVTQGVYDVPAATTNLTGTLTLSGDKDSVFIFRMPSTLITAGTSKVVLDGVQACNVFWKVGSSATFDGTTEMVGTVIASASISFTGGGATLDGRVIAQTAAITFNNTTINRLKCAPDLSTDLSADTVPENTTFYDTATLFGDTSTSGGTVTYAIYNDSACTSVYSAAGVVAVTNGNVPNSSTLGISAAGTYYMQAVYSGDANNEDATSVCISEPIIVTSVTNPKTSPILTTLLSDNAITVGDSVNDTAILNQNGGTAVPTGSVVYTVYTNNICTIGAQAAGTVDLVGGSVPDLISIPFNTAGTYYWRAVYSGDTNYNGAVSTCNVADENLVVSKASPSLTTTLSSNGVTVGGSIYDSADLTGATSTAVGTVTYTVYSDSACTLNPQAGGIKTVVNGVVPDSDPVTFNTAGIYYWQAVFSGGPNNNPATSVCGTEVLVVSQARQFVTTILSDYFIPVGGTVNDSAILFGATPDAGGTVTYTVFSNPTCTANPQSAGIKNVVNGIAPDSDPITFNTPGTYYWQVVYSGDINNTGGTSICLSEILTVQAAPVPSPTSVPPAAPVLPGTGFAPQRVTVLSAQPADKAYAELGDLWLEIPRLGVQMPILGVPQQANGEWDVSWLGKNAGWLNGTAFPTWEGNSVMTGHLTDAFGNGGPFAHLNWMWWGDKVIVHAWGAQYVYEVRQIYQVSAGSISAAIKHEELPWVTLITCRGDNEATNSYTYRVIVRAVLIDVK